MKQLPPMRTGVKKSIHMPKHSSKQQNLFLFQFSLAVGIDTSLNHPVTDLPTSVPRSSCNTAGNTPLGLKQHKKVHHMVELSPGWRARDRRPRVTAKQVEIMKPIRGMTTREYVRSGYENGEGSYWEGFLVNSRTHPLLAHRLNFKDPPLSL